jgi:hypothetical protein
MQVEELISVLLDLSRVLEFVAHLRAENFFRHIDPRCDPVSVAVPVRVG